MGRGLDEPGQPAAPAVVVDAQARCLKRLAAHDVPPGSQYKRVDIDRRPPGRAPERVAELLEHLGPLDELLSDSSLR